MFAYSTYPSFPKEIYIWERIKFVFKIISLVFFLSSEQLKP